MKGNGHFEVDAATILPETGLRPQRARRGWKKRAREQGNGTISRIPIITRKRGLVEEEEVGDGEIESKRLKTDGKRNISNGGKGQKSIGIKRGIEIQGVAAARGGTCINHLLFADDCVIFSKASRKEWLAIHDILMLYEASSGQMLNRQKTALLFSSNTKESVKREILQEAGDDSLGVYGKYLGLPTMIGRSKYETFKGIKERVWKKVSSWKNSFLSSAGREVLIKAVLQSIPTYTMNVFRFPRKLSQELNSMLARFWWNGNKEGRGIHWRGWGLMGSNKKEGGMGFRDIDNFNKAMLAKQGWMLQTRLDSLAARIFKEKYYKTGHFVEAKIGYKPSYMWRSLMSAQALVKAGCVWRVGNGKSISIWNDRWLPNAAGFMVRSPVNRLEADSKVSSLIFEDIHCWNEVLVGEIFSRNEAAQICSIPLSWYGEEDKMLWGYTKDGREGFGECSNRQAQKKVWEGIWNLAIPNSAKQFLWKAVNSILPTKHNLCMKRILEDASCPICGLHEETIGHALWSCPAASDVWAEKESGLQKWICAERDFYQTWTDMQDRLQKNKVEEIVMILRGLWYRRNQLVFEGKFENPSRVVTNAISSLKCFQTSQADMIQIKVPSPVRRKDTNWKPPDVGVSKLNFDAAIDKVGNRMGLGIVARNHLGELLFSFSTSRLFSGTSDTAEAAGLWKAMDLAVELGIRNVVYEGDAERIIKGVTEEKEAVAWMDQLFKDMRGRLLNRPDWSVQFIHREGNSVAYELAKRVLRIEGEWCWIEEGPAEIASLITRDRTLL
ncbi:hypothetical protein I3843_16G069700 [Carya illinoinensis]|nr:hypothetical protein I3843_16G069700 [Carya illinoinensis]